MLVVIFNKKSEISLEIKVLLMSVAVFSPGRGLSGFPQKILRWRIKSQEDAPVRAQDQASSQTDFQMFEYFNGQSNTPAFCLFK